MANKTTAAPSGFDLASLDALTAAQEDGIDVPIEHPVSGDPLGITIRVAGPDSQRQRKAYRRMLDARMRSGKRRIEPEEAEGETLLYLARTLIGWTFSSGVTIDGEVPEFSVDAAVSLFRRFPFIREQIDAAAASRAGFSKTSSRS